MPSKRARHASAPEARPGRPAVALPWPAHGSLPWPLPALVVWTLAWVVFAVGRWTGGAPAAALLVALVAGGVAALAIDRPWRRLVAAAGFPLSAALAAGAVHWPPWVWLAALVALALLYPVRAWRDAPWFPTPPGALDALGAVVVPPPLRLLDAGCGLGHGLRALHRVWPEARLEGIEWSRPLAWLARRRCRHADVRRGDMWAAPWSHFDLVYVFQRPESMARAHAKAVAELAHGGWLASLEFEVPGRTPHARLHTPDGRPLWLYRIEGRAPGSRSTIAAAGR
jgi:hypothetical protein